MQLDTNESLNHFWVWYLYSGSLPTFLKHSLLNIGLPFGFVSNVIYSLAGVVNAWWLSQSLYIKYPLSNIANILSYFYLISFLVGNWFLVKNKRYTFLICLYGFLVLEFIAALLKLWPFGDARTNLFSIFLITIVPFYAFAELFKKLRGIYLTCFLLVLAIIAIITFPYQFAYDAVTENSNFIASISDSELGMADQRFSEVIAKHSKPGDLVLLSVYSFTEDFQYYYQFSDYTKPYPNRTKDVIYTSSPSRIISVPKYLYEPSAKLPRNIWIVFSDLDLDKEQVPSFVANDYKKTMTVYSYNQFLVKYSMPN
jgi:hypothetical protein